jgi:hypothetical protein
MNLFGWLLIQYWRWQWKRGKITFMMAEYLESLHG